MTKRLTIERERELRMIAEYWPKAMQGITENDVVDLLDEIEALREDLAAERMRVGMLTNENEALAEEINRLGPECVILEQENAQLREREGVLPND